MRLMTRAVLMCSLLSMLAFAENAFAEESAPTTVETTGEAAIGAAGAPAAKDKAIEDALRKAVEQACGTLVVANTLTENSQLVSDKILTKASGYVSKYEVLSSNEKKGVVAVTVRAQVGTSKLADDLAAIGLTIARKGMPRVAIVLVEQSIDEQKGTTRWDDKGATRTVSQRIGESTLVEEWLKKGFTFVDPETVASGARVAGVVNTLPSEVDVRKLGEKLPEADVVIVGNVLATKMQEVSKLLEGVSNGAKNATGVTCSATITLRALNTDNGTILAVGEETAQAMNQSQLACGRDATVKATKSLAERLQKDLIATWQKELNQGNRVKVVIKAIDSISVYNTLKNNFGTTIRGAKVAGTRFNKGTADLDVYLTGSVDDAAAQMEAWKLSGKKLKVTAMTANTIEAEVTK